MELTIGHTRIDWSDGLGLSPVSLFIELVQKDETKYHGRSLEEVYIFIKDAGTNDVIIYGEINTYADVLSWLTPKLIADGVFTSVVSDIKEQAKVYTIASRTIHKMNKDNHKLLKLVNFRNLDIILIESDNIKELLALRSVRLSNNAENVTLFNSNLVSKEEALEAGVIELYPCAALR